MKAKDADAKRTTWNITNSPQPGGAVYGFGLLGALFYYFQNADTIWMALLGILKAIIWPGILVYKVLGL